MRRSLDPFAFGTMLVLCVIWGVQQVAIKIAAPDVAPIVQVALRTGISATLLGLLVLARRRARPSFRNGTWRAGLLASLLFGVEFVFIAEGLRHTSASHMVVFLYTAPVFAALGLHLLVPTERLSRAQWLGIGLAFAGIVVAFASFSGGGAPIARTLLGDGLGVLAGAAWGVTTVVVRASKLSEAPPAQTLLYQLAGGFVVLAAYAAGSGQAGQIAMTPTAWVSLLFQGIVVSFASYLTWFWMLRRYLATRLAVFSFMTPLFGVTSGVLFLSEPIGARFAAGAALVLAGITVVSGAQGPPARARAA